MATVERPATNIVCPVTPDSKRVIPLVESRLLSPERQKRTGNASAFNAVTGIVIYQEGVGDSRTGYRYFLLPLKIATGTIERALKTSKEALEEANAHQEETKEEPAEKPKEEEGCGEEAPEDEGGDK